MAIKTRWQFMAFILFFLAGLSCMAQDDVGDMVTDKKKNDVPWLPWRSHESNLRDLLMSGYDKSARPFPSTNVSFIPTIKHFDMNEKLQTLDLDVWTTMNWFDPRLMWDREQYNGIKSLVFHKGEIWEPDLSIYNNAEITKFSIMGSNRLEVRHDGRVLSIPAAHLKAACVMDLTLWPYDAHNCTVNYGSWVYDGTAINLDIITNKPRIDIEQLHSIDKNLTRGEWRLLQAGLVRNINKYACCDDPFIDVDLSLLLKRNAPAYIWTVQLPIIVLFCVTSLVFILPPGGSEKLVFGGICIILNVFLLEYCSRITGHSPSHTPLIVQLVGQQLKLTSASMLMCAIVVRLVRAPYLVPFPNCLRSLLCVCVPCLCVGRYVSTAARTSSGNGSVLSRSTTMTVEDVEMGDNGSASASLYPQERKQTVMYTSSPTDWVLLGSILDRLCFIVYIIVVVVFLTEYRNVL